MTQEEMQKAEQMASRMLNEYGMGQLANFGIYKKLIISLYINDINTLVDNRIYFNPIFSPDSQNKLNLNLERGANIITIDLNTIKLFSSDEGTAIILHEIGHALNPELKNIEGEYAADNYASERGFTQYISSSLEKGKLIRPAEFSTQSTELRIERLNNNN
jgi:hypothetical protein